MNGRDREDKAKQNDRTDVLGLAGRRVDTCLMLFSCLLDGVLYRRRLEKVH